MTSGYQGYYDNYQYNQTYNYAPEQSLPGQYNTEQYSQATTYQSYTQANSYPATEQFNTSYAQDGTQYPQYPNAEAPTQNTYEQNAQSMGYTQYVSENSNASYNQQNYGPNEQQNYVQNNQSYPQNGPSFQQNGPVYGQSGPNYVPSAPCYGASDASYGTNVQGFSGSNFPSNNNITDTGFSQNSSNNGSYASYVEPHNSKDFNQNPTDGYMQGTNNVGEVVYNPVSQQRNNTGYIKDPQINSNYGAPTSNPCSNDNRHQNQFNQRNNLSNQRGGYSNFRYDTRPPPPPPCHVQQTPRGNSYGNDAPRFQKDLRGRGPDRTFHWRGAPDRQYDRGRGSWRGRGSREKPTPFSQNSGTASRPTNNNRGGRGFRHHREAHQGNQRGFTLPQDKLLESVQQQAKSEEIMQDYMKPQQNGGKNGELQAAPAKIQKDVNLGGVTGAENVQASLPEELPAGQSVIPANALAGLGDKPFNPDLEVALKELMQPLYCRLCSVNLNATSQARQHYEGKNHAKKVRTFLAGYSSSTPIKTEAAASDQVKDASGSEQSKGSEEKSTETTTVDEEVYCKVCDVAFTSVKQSTQHYQGKNHAKKVRLAAASAAPAPCDNIIKGEGTQFECVMCSVHVTSQEQLNMHLNGSKHKNKLRQQHRSTSSMQGRQGHGEWLGQADFAARRGGFKRSYSRENSWQGSEEGQKTFQPSGYKRARQEFSNYRTPSGKFYCSCCNVTLNVESQFAQHVSSKRHKTNQAMQRNNSDHSEN